jgi:hypothetical protein
MIATIVRQLHLLAMGESLLVAGREREPRSSFLDVGAEVDGKHGAEERG